MTSSAAQDEELVKRFLAEAPPAWKKFDEATKYAQGSADWTIRTWFGESLSAKKLVPTIRIELAHNDKCRSITTRSLKFDRPETPLGGGKAFVKNANYLFEAERKSAEDQWHLDHIGKEWSDAHHFTPSTIRGWLVALMGVGAAKHAETAPFPRFYFHSLSQYFSNDGFTVTEIEVKEDGIWRVGFRFDEKKSGNVAGEGIVTGSIEFDPTNDWRQVRSEFLRESFRTTYEFGYPQGEKAKSALPNTMEMALFRIDKDSGDSTEYFHFLLDINLAVPDKLPPDSEFTATAYGLKEPDLEQINERIK